MKNILAIDGGGVRSFIPLKILHEIELRTGYAISELFDYFSGVSAGSIVVSLLLIKGEDGKPKYNTSHILQVFEECCKNVFYYTYLDRITSGFGLIGPCYSNDRLEQTLLEHLGTQTLNDLLKPACFISYNITNSTPYYFSKEDTPEISVLDSVMASTAAPTYFNPHSINDSLYVDGGVVTNNPCEICFLKAVDQKKQNYYTLSLATGFNSTRSRWSYGIFGWSSHIIDMLLHANDSTQSFELQLVQKALSEENCFQRINFPLSEEIRLDDTAAFPTMTTLMDKWIEENDDLINQLCDKLIRNYHSK